MKNNRAYKGLLQLDGSREIYQICDVNFNKKEIILSIIPSNIFKAI
ncbi:hypothetical protein [Muriicola sp.]